MAKKAKKSPLSLKKQEKRHLPLVYPISKTGQSVEEVVNRILSVVKSHPDWTVTKTEIKPIKAVWGKEPNRARIVGILTIQLKCK